MKNSVKLLLAGTVLVVGMGASAVQANTLDVVRDSNGTPIRTMAGDCVRSQWSNTYDACKGESPAMIAPQLLTQVQSIYFGLGQSTLTKQAKKSLDILVGSVADKQGPYMSVSVAGFADRIGSATANEKLSKKRADNVRKYLLSKGIVNAQVVETRWFGDSVTATKCSKKLPKEKLIKCLQPDRRVDV